MRKKIKFCVSAEFELEVDSEWYEGKSFEEVVELTERQLESPDGIEILFDCLGSSAIQVSSKKEHS